MNLSFKNFFLPKLRGNEFTIDRYIHDLKQGTFRDKWNFGVLESQRWNLSNMVQEPNAMFLGAMGSGKSVAAMFSTLTWMLANSDQTILFIADTLKGANDYKELFDYPQVFPILNSDEGIHRVIDLIYDEVMARKEVFSSVKANNIFEYEKIKRRDTGNKDFKMARCVLMVEEFHSIPYNVLEFDKNYKIPNTSAFKLFQLMKIGRSYGTWVVACSQKGTKSDVPPEIIGGFLNKQIFRVSPAESSYFLQHIKAAEIAPGQHGRCETSHGTCQFPYIKEDSQKRLLQQYMKPLDAECCYLTPKLIEDYLGGRSTEELYRLKKLPDLISGIESYDADLVIAMLHKKLGHKVTQVDSKLDPFGISLTVDWPNRGKIAVMIRAGSKKITGKHLVKLVKGMKSMNCDRGILYTSAEDLPSTVYKNAVDLNIEVVDHEDMLRLARQIEAKAQNLKDLDPSKLADDSKENGDYQSGKKIQEDDEDDDDEDENPIDSDEVSGILDSTPPKTSFIKPIEDVPVLGKEESSQLDEEDENSKILSDLLENKQDQDKEENNQKIDTIEVKVKTEEEKTFDDSIEGSLLAQGRINVKAVKRLPVRGQFFLKNDEAPEMLVHLHKNIQGEVYRVLFYVMVNKQVVHKYFIDRQVQGDFDAKDKAKLSIFNTNDWNKQVDDINNRAVLSAGEFEKSVLIYLDNFKQYELGMVKVICWSEDVSFLQNILKKSRYMDSNPTVFEEMAEIYGTETDREVLMSQNTLNIKRQDLFTPIEIDFQIWKMISP